MEASVKLVGIRYDDRLRAQDRARQIAETVAEISKLADQRVKLADDPLQKRLEAFIAAEEAGNAEAMKKMIETFAEGYASRSY